MKNRSPSFEMGKVHPLSNKDPAVKLSVNQLIKNNSYNKKHKIMKKYTLLSLLIVILVSNQACSKSDDLDLQENQNGFRDIDNSFINSKEKRNFNKDSIIFHFDVEHNDELDSLETTTNKANKNF